MLSLSKIKNFHIILCFVVSCWASTAIAQSDDCIDAEELIVQKSCITEAGLTNDFINEPLENSCGGNTDDDGWYKFKAISEVTIIKVVSATGNDMGIAIFLDDCLQERTCANSTTQGGTEIITLATQIGRDYFLQVYDVRQGPGAFFICLTSLPNDPISDCDQAEVICTSGAFAFNPIGIGTDDFERESNQSGCLLSKENQSAWYYFEIQPTAPPNLFLTMTLTPENSPDYDFAIFGPNVDCTELGYPIRCSYADRNCSFCPSTGLGMETKDATESVTGDGFVTPLKVQPGEGFFLLIDNFSVTATGFILEWGGTAAPYLNCNSAPPCGLFAEVGPPISLCEETEITLNATIRNNSSTVDDITYIWEAKNGANSFLDDATSPSPILTLPDNLSGTLNYLLTISTGACRHTDLLEITKKCFVTDEEKCAFPIIPTIDMMPPTCINPESGSIQIGLIEGGTPPFQFQVNNRGFQSNFIFPELAIGQHLLSIKDALGCLLDTTIYLPPPVFPILDLGMDISINQGDSIELYANTNIPLKQIRGISWTGISVDNCLSPCLTLNTAPSSSINVVATINSYNDCEIEDEISILVNPKNNIYIPSAFSPNGDGINDIFTIFSGSGITTIHSLKIFNRWGNLVFLANDLPPNISEYGWNGTYHNKQLAAGVYIYMVEILMPDQTIERLVGEIFLSNY